MVSVNNSTSGAEAHLPFGGNGKSGNGSRQSGIWVLDQFTRWQSMNWDYAGKLQKAQMDIVELPGDPEFRLPYAAVGASTGAWRYQFGDVFGGGQSGAWACGRRDDGRRVRDVAGECLAEGVVEAVDGLRPRRRRTRAIAAKSGVWRSTP